jgi:hypothetical protein
MKCIMHHAVYHLMIVEHLGEIMASSLKEKKQKINPMS